MVNTRLLERLAADILEVSVDADEDEVKSAFTQKSSEWHPDVNDDPDATDKFIALQAARDVLQGEVDYSDPDGVRSTRNNLEKLFGEEEINQIESETRGRASYRSTAEERSDPESYTREDFATASGKEKREMIKDISLGVETVIIYQAVEGMYELEYTEEQFFKDVNDYIVEARQDRIDFDDYYQATKDSLREEVTEQLFINSCEKIQENLQREYGEGTNIREVARIVAHFMVQGGIKIGDIGRFVGGGRGGGDDRFTRGHPLGGHGRKRRGDRRYTRGNDRYERR